MKRIVWPVLLALLFLAGLDSYAQTPMERVYADAQTPDATILIASVTNPENAIDGNVATFSSLNAYLGALGVIGVATQNLSFSGPELPSPSTPITVKIGFGASVLNLLGGISVQATLNGTGVGPIYSGNELLGLLGGTNQSEVTFTPNTNYNGIRVSVRPTLGVGVSANVYHAYFLKPAAGPAACNEVEDILYGVGSYGVNAAGVTGGVNNEWNSVDQDLDTYSTMNIGVQALAYVHQTIVYNNPSRIGDSIRVVLSDPAGLLELELLTNFQIQAYLGNQPVGPLIDGSSDLLDIDLLGLLGDPNPKTVAAFSPPGVQFDRIQIRLESVVGLLDGIRIHEVSRVAPTPTISGLTDGMIAICKGETITLTIDNPESNAVYHWFDAAEGGTEITTGVDANGTSFILEHLSVGTHDFYVSVSRDGCIEESSARAKVVVVVQPTPGSPEITLIHSH